MLRNTKDSLNYFSRLNPEKWRTKGRTIFRRRQTADLELKMTLFIWISITFQFIVPGVCKMH